MRVFGSSGCRNGAVSGTAPAQSQLDNNDIMIL